MNYPVGNLVPVRASVFHHAPDRVIVVGLAPPRGTPYGAPALGPTAPTGRRLEELVGASLKDHVATANLVDFPIDGMTGKGKANALYEGGRLLRPLLVGREVVCLGRVVARYVGVDPLAPLCRWVNLAPGIGPRRFAIVPHPSGLNRWWNVPANVDTARAFLRDLTHEEDR